MTRNILSGKSQKLKGIKMTTKNETSEHEIEQYFCESLLAIAGWHAKFVSPSQNGLPDRVCAFPGTGVFFVEFKSATGELSDIQRHENLRIAHAGGHIFIIDSIAACNALFCNLAGNKIDLKATPQIAADSFVDRPWKRGYAAYEAGAAIEEEPTGLSLRDANQWRIGWHAANHEYVTYMQKEPGFNP